MITLALSEIAFVRFYLGINSNLKQHKKGCPKFLDTLYLTIKIYDLHNSHYTVLLVGGTAWESNPPDLARRSQAVLKTVEDTSTPFSPVIIIVER
jgi:hypothetical protein